MKNCFRLITAILFLTCFFNEDAFAGRGDKTKSIHTPEGGSPVIVGTATAKDSIELDPLGINQRDYTVRNRISFGVDIHYPEFVAGPQLVEVSMLVKQYDVNNSPLPDLTFKLNIAYYHHDTLHSKILHNYEFDDAYRMEFQIDTIRINGTITNTLPKNLFVQGDIFVERYTALTLGAMSPQHELLDVDCNTISDGIKFKWSAVVGAEEYQVEFLHISDYGSGNTTQLASALAYNFRHNSTRVTTSALSYDIALLFDRGWIAYRVRAVGVDIDDPNHLIFGEWSAPVSGTIESLSSKVQITDAEVHEKAFNWQYSATYAEQGKRKEVITYYDGTLRNRQAVTKINSENNVIVGETFYDHQGRPTVTALPTPVEFPSCEEDDAQPIIKYYPEFNKNSNGQTYSKADFDLSPEDECAVSADAMTTSSGASRYYSPENPNQNLHQAYVPDAQGYPFQQVEYTPDNTGRINRQGGVGPEFQIGSGKEAQYLYGNPNQLELNRIFGSEVGYYQHYQKNAVIDANGQVSISYIDMAGRVIATALAGAAPENMVTLDAPNSDTLEVNHIFPDGSNQEIDLLTNSVTFSTSFIVTAPTPALIDYGIISIPMIDTCLNDICIDCVYELQLSLKDDCGMDLLSDTTLQNKIVGNFQLDTLGNYIFHEQCETNTTFSTQAEVYLNIGKYTLAKRLTVKEEALYSYLDLIDSSDCVLRYNDFLAAELLNVDSSICVIDCDNCLEQLGTLEAFISNGHGTSGEYYARVEECMDLCEERKTDCELYYTMLQIDMSPGGQYGEYLNPSTGAVSLSFPLSIYVQGHLLPNTAASWRAPILHTPNGTESIYVDDFGQRSKVYLSEDPNNPGDYIPAPLANNLVQFDAVAEQHYIYPEQLLSVVDFIDYFEQSWALSLVSYHPEYCYYESCIMYESQHAETDAYSSYSFDQLLLNTNTFLEAQARGFVNASGEPELWFYPNSNNPTDATKPWDPFVFYPADFEQQPACDDFSDKLVQKYNHFEFQFGQWYSMPQIAAYTARCGSNFPSVPPVDCYNFGQLHNGVMDTVILNQEWRLLKAMYMSAKQEQQQNLANCKALYYCTAYNECIGNDQYFPYSAFIALVAVSPIYHPLWNPFQPCALSKYHLYRNKTKRFSTHEDAAKEDANSTAYELYLQTGQCPNAFSLQHLLDEIVQANKLTATSFNLNSTGYLSALFQANNSYYNPGALPSLEYTATTTTNTITADWIDVANSSVLATLTLEKTASQSWNEVSGIINLFATGAHTFTAEAIYNDLTDTVTPVKVFSITGSITYFDLNGCAFEQECNSNQLAIDLTTVFNVLNMDGNLPPMSPLNISSYTSSTLGTTVNLSSIYIQNAANSGTNLSMVYDVPSNAYRIFNASLGNNNGLYIKVLQSSGTLASSITLVEPMVSTGNYSFSMNVQQSVGYPVAFSGVMYQIHGNDTIGISAGDCSLPTPNKCKELAYEVFEDLQPLLEDVLIRYTGPSSDINLYTSIYTTPAIVSVLPYGETETTSVDTGDTLVISAGDCDLNLSIETSQYVQFNNIIGLSNFELTGDLNLQSAYTNFIVTGEFQTPSGSMFATINGSTCFSLKECNPCLDSSSLAGGIQRFAVVFDDEKNSRLNPTMLPPAFNCIDAYESYLDCEQAFYAQNGYYALDLSSPDFVKYPFCNCIDEFCDFLMNTDFSSLPTNTLAGRMRYVQTTFQCAPVEDTVCTSAYANYLSCVNNFNQNYSYYNITPLSASVFETNSYCTCADAYCNILNEVLAQQLQFTSSYQFEQFTSFSNACSSTCYDYPNYVNRINYYNANTNTYQITEILPEELFNAYGYCNCFKYYNTEIIADILINDLEFENQAHFDNYVSLARFCSDDQINNPEDPCKTAYTEYLQCTRYFNSNNSILFLDAHGNYHNLQLGYIPWETFDSLNLCNCVHMYCSALDAAQTGLVSFGSQLEYENYIFSQLDCNVKPPCTPAPSTGITPEMPTVELENDCIAVQISLATINAQNQYNQYMDSVKTVHRQKYLDHCLSTQEQLYTSYGDRQHHYTLYYYDNAGNLIKTIPPEGVELLDITSDNDALNIKINNDRNNGLKTVFTAHRLQTRYEYNSLNQLVAQFTPDTDPMEAFEQTLPNGLHNRLQTNKIQMLNGSLGYLAGQVNSRGYLYKTTDGGETWSRMYNLVAADLKKIVMLDNQYGIAIGEAGTVLKTIDGGNTWDMIITWDIPEIIDSLNDIAVMNPTTSPEIMIVGNNGLAVRCLNFPSNPSFSLVSAGLSGNVLSVETLNGSFYCTAHDLALGLSRFYKYASSAWAELKDVRNNTFSDVHTYAPNKAYAVDYDGRIYANVDIANIDTKWIHRSSNLKDPIRQVRFFSEQQGIALVEENGERRLYRTTDGATSWTRISDSTFTAIAMDKDVSDSTIVAVGEDRKMAIIFPYSSGVDQLVEVKTPTTATDFTAVWIEKNGVNTHVVATDDQTIYYTTNALTQHPVWFQNNYSSTGSEFVKIEASVSGATIYGVGITASGAAWRLKKETTAAVELGSSFSGSGYAGLTFETHFYLSTATGTTLQRADVSVSTTLTNAGTLPFASHHLSIRANNLLVANSTGNIASLLLTSGSISTTKDHTKKVYPDKVNVLTRDETTNKLLAFGNDGLAYHVDGTDLFAHINNTVNEHIYDATFNNAIGAFVGQNGLAKRATIVGNNSISSADLQTITNADLYAVSIGSSNRFYAAGENGALLYSPNYVTSNVSLLNQGNIRLNGIGKKAGSNNVFVVGENGLIQEQVGAMTLVKKDIFTPELLDVHFKNASEGTFIAGSGLFVIRSMSNGAKWNIVRPQGTNDMNSNYEKVWTVGNGKSLIFGDNQTLICNQGVTSVAFSTDAKVVSKGTNNSNIYVFDYNNSIKRIDLNTLSVSTIKTLTTGNVAVKAMHVFSNGDYILVGNSGLYRHFIDNDEVSYSTSLPMANFNDIAFKDNLNGIIVGDGGLFYRTSNPQPTTEGYLHSSSWQSRDLNGTDPLGIQNANIYTVALASSVDVLIGGFKPYNGELYPYVRKIYDAGGRYSNRFYYDRLGRLVVSRNARQEAEKKFSYTLYDALGRVVEAGEKTENASGILFKGIFGTMVSGYFNPVTIDDTKLNDWVAGNGARKEVTRSYYDEITIAGLPSVMADDHTTQRHRILHVTYEAVYDGDDQTYDHATHYRYDIHGNVKTLLQDNKQMAETFPSIASQQFKRMDYSYDLLSGNVHRMSVQNGEADQWHHAYVYDADNRIRQVYTSSTTPLTDIDRLTQNKQNELIANSDWQNDAQYYYYDHGPLARVEIGQNNLQGVDYYYNLQGWLKGVNSSVLDAEHDPGTDSDQNEVNALFAKDVFGFGLNYYQGDYVAIGGATPQASINATSNPANNSNNLYNGNIRYMQTSITNPETRESMPMLNAYMYDQLNRLISSRSYETDLASNSWNPTTYDESYYNRFVYDAMGNILGQKRHKRDGTQIESLEYHYHRIDNKLLRNRLYHVNDYIDSLVDDTDIDDMGQFYSSEDSIHLYNNYVYDAEGRLVKDRQEEIDTIIWRVDGKVKEIRRPLTSEKKNLIFEYNSFGQRIAKHVHNAQTDVLEKSTYYILDAQGNSMSTYDHIVGFDDVSYYLKERNIYGSSRLGMRHDTLNMMNPAPETSYGITGNRNYELNNHLGNVLTVINDQVYPISSDNTTIDGYTVGIDNVYDYSPFGVQLDGRTIEKQYETITDTVFVTNEDIVYTSDFVVDQSLAPRYDGWYGSINFSALSIQPNGTGHRLKAVSTHQHQGMNHIFDVVSGTNYRMTFDFDKGTLAQGRVLVFNIDNLGNTVQIGNFYMNGTGTLPYTFSFTPTQSRILIKFQGLGTFYMDNFVLEQATQVNVHQTGFESAVMVEPSIHGWTFDKGTTLGWHTTGQLNGRYGALQRHVSGLTAGLYRVDLYVNIGSNASVTIKIYGKDITGNLNFITEKVVTASGNQTTPAFNPASYPTIVISVEPQGTSPYWIDNYNLSMLVSLMPTTYQSIESNNFNLFPLLFSPSIDGWEFNTQTERASVVTVSGSKRLNFNRVEQTFTTTNGNPCVFSLSKLKVGSGTNPSGDIRVRIIDVNTNTVILNQTTTAASPSFTFTAMGPQTKIEIQNINIAANTMIYIDNLIFSTTNYTPIYSSNFESTVIVQSDMDGWLCDLNSAYLLIDAPSGQEERLIVLGNNVNSGAYQDFNVIPGYNYTLKYRVAYNTAGTMHVKVNQGATTIASDSKTTAGTYTLNFTPTTSTVRVHFTGNVQIMLNYIQLEYEYTDTIVTVTPPRTAYRYQFNGMEVDNEPKGKGNSYTTEFRQYDPRLGRWLSIDPLFQNFPWQSPYVAFDNNPILLVDPKGLAASGPSPHSIANVLNYGAKHSKTFSALMKRNGITAENFSDYITDSNGKISSTNTATGNIVLKSNTDIKRMVIEVTHELTNRLLIEKAREYEDQVAKGEITPKEFAQKWAILEIEGQINQVKVAADIGYRTGHKTSDDFVDAYAKDRSLDIRKRMIAGDTHIKKYTNIGERLRADYIQNKANIQSVEGISGFRFDSNVAKKSKDGSHLIIKEIDSGEKMKVTRNSETGKYSKYEN